MTVDRARLADTLLEIVAEVSDPSALPGQLCAACLRALPIDGVGVSLMSGRQAGGRVLLGASGAIGHRMEDLQFELGEGPSISAVEDGQPVLVPDVLAEDARSRWPMFVQSVETTDVRALFTFPLQLGAISFGALGCYRSRAGPLDEVVNALVVAEAVTLALLQAQAKEVDGNGHRSWLTEAVVDYHPHVHQAVGMVSAQLEASVEEAFVRLRGHAFRYGRSLEDVGADVVARRLRFTGDELMPE
ncbi:GAF and ANTAR domain-containing protein [Haloechinothrix sp. YIM 98757]|uniref:GAF and ANTAR domain-containing protein n=1 Tax=Haloechinothrix aidingensis TaxID=2752311 RepID=A0A838AEW1_9PSEU|nr:GAF and ANTAR domain-containing protein [Haloechinothrix aidingensis]MBA0127856.1 GAF and ANTAR domain-containing protein [Haloechinothrix aidingensis]